MSLPLKMIFHPLGQTRLVLGSQASSLQDTMKPSNSFVGMQFAIPKTNPELISPLRTWADPKECFEN